jgi:hypothetical protein
MTLLLLMNPMLRTSHSARLGRQFRRDRLPRYLVTWSGHVQACVQDWPIRSHGMFVSVDHDRSRT